MRNASSFLSAIFLTVWSISCTADLPIATTKPVALADKLPHVQVDVKARQVRIECESCNVNQDVGLEFFCVLSGTNEYEAVISTKAKPSHIHLGLLMIGLETGTAVRYSDSLKKMIPPHGTPVRITCEWKKGEETVRVSASRLMRNRKTKKEAPEFNWIFVGSKVMEDGKYAADTVGYVASVLNSELAVLDIPEIKGSDLESREWDRNGDLLPPVGTTIYMVLEPIGKLENKAGAAAAADMAAKLPSADAAIKPVPAAAIRDDLGTTILAIDATGKVTLDGMKIGDDRVMDALSNRRAQTKVKISAAAGAPADVVAKLTKDITAANLLADSDAAVAPAATGNEITNVTADDEKVRQMKKLWEKKVAPHSNALREAANAHFQAIETLRKEQQRLIDEADRIQRTIDELQKQYSDMTTPRPEE